jgi:hypothetical protein
LESSYPWGTRVRKFLGTGVTSSLGMALPSMRGRRASRARGTRRRASASKLRRGCARGPRPTARETRGQSARCSRCAGRCTVRAGPDAFSSVRRFAASTPKRRVGADSATPICTSTKLDRCSRASAYCTRTLDHDQGPIEVADRVAHAHGAHVRVTPRQLLHRPPLRRKRQRPLGGRGGGPAPGGKAAFSGSKRPRSFCVKSRRTSASDALDASPRPAGRSREACFPPASRARGCGAVAGSAPSMLRSHRSSEDSRRGMFGLSVGHGERVDQVVPCPRIPDVDGHTREPPCFT